MVETESGAKTHKRKFRPRVFALESIEAYRHPVSFPCNHAPETGWLVFYAASVWLFFSIIEAGLNHSQDSSQFHTSPFFGREFIRPQTALDHFLTTTAKIVPICRYFVACKRESQAIWEPSDVWRSEVFFSWWRENSKFRG